MKKTLLFTMVSVLLLTACSTRKRVATAVNSGQYNQAIQTALDKLRKNKDKKRHQDYTLILKEAYTKVVARDLNTINRLKEGHNPEDYKAIYNTYLTLDQRQEAIKPLIPLYVNGKAIPFQFSNYDAAILNAKSKLTQHLYTKSHTLLKSKDKYAAREAHQHLSYLQRIHPNYKNTTALLSQAHEQGKSYILVTIHNDTQQIIPRRLEDDLLNFDTYGLNKFWSVYHANKAANTTYDYAMHLNLKQINISPERINEREINREREIREGWTYEKDANGNVLKDSLGNDIKHEKLIRIRCRLYETIQTKSAQVIADVVYLDTRTQQILDTFSIDSGFIFEHIFATYRGDKRALNADDRRLLNNRRRPFPSNEQMVFDSGEDLKLKLKDIISGYTIR